VVIVTLLTFVNFDKKNRWVRKKPANRKPSKAIPIGDLLGKTVQRIGIRQQITIANTIAAASKCLNEICSSSQRGDMKAGNLKNGILTIYCLNGPSSRFINQKKEKLHNFVKRSVPESDLKDISTRIVDRFPSSEVC